MVLLPKTVALTEIIYWKLLSYTISYDDNKEGLTNLGYFQYKNVITSKVINHLVLRRLIYPDFCMTHLLTLDKKFATY